MVNDLPYSRRVADGALRYADSLLPITLGSINDAVITADAETRIPTSTQRPKLLGLDLNSVETRRVDEVIDFVDPDSSKTAREPHRAMCAPWKGV
jgi:hypothetical protein